MFRNFFFVLFALGAAAPAAAGEAASITPVAYAAAPKRLDPAGALSLVNQFRAERRLGGLRLDPAPRW